MRTFLKTCTALATATVLLQGQQIHVDLNRRMGPLKPIHAFFGADEPNYTYMKDGKKLLGELAALTNVPVHFRVHNLLTSGDGQPSLKWGSTNVYTEDASGRPVYNWTIVDRIFDTLVERKMKPLVELGFMPEALSVKPQPYRHTWSLGAAYTDIFTGWAHPPKDFSKWGELIYQVAKHAGERYGKAEAESWWWEVWNEPNIGYWKGTPEEYHKLYDFAADAVKRALPGARIGGPTTTGPGGRSGAATFLRDFLEHCVRGKNYATGKTGAPLDYITFHAKGRPQVAEGSVVMGIENQMRDLSVGFEIVASFPELRSRPIIIGESDPEGCAACSSRVYPHNNYRNGTMYSSYTTSIFARHYDLAERHKVNLEGAVTWAFEFEDQPYFDGFRDLATNGIDKPVLNTFRMLGMMGGYRAAVDNPALLSADDMIKAGVKEKADINALASRDAQSASVMVWNYHDSQKPGPDAPIDLTVNGLPDGRMLVQHYRVDETHSNAYALWKKMGSPAKPDAAQYAQLEQAGQLQLLEAPRWIFVAGGKAKISFPLPRHGVSLLRFSR